MKGNENLKIVVVLDGQGSPKVIGNVAIQ